MKFYVSTEDYLALNEYWSELENKWGRNAVDLDSYETSRRTCAKRLSNDDYYERHPEIVRSCSDMDSPITITGFFKTQAKRLSKIKGKKIKPPPLAIQNDPIHSSMKETFIESEVVLEDWSFDDPTILEYAVIHSEKSSEDEGIFSGKSSSLYSKKSIATSSPKSKLNDDEIRAFFNKLVENVPPPELYFEKRTNEKYEDIIISSSPHIHGSATKNTTDILKEEHLEDYVEFTYDKLFSTKLNADFMPETSTLKDFGCLTSSSSSHCDLSYDVTVLYNSETSGPFSSEDMFVEAVCWPPENDLQKNSDRVLSEHELRVQKSLQKLNVPEWYKNTPTPREGFLLRKRYSDASNSAARWSGLNSKTTSLGSLGGALAPPAQLSPATTSFGRWSTSRLNSNTTSPCSSTRSSVRGTSPLCSPSTRSSFSARQPYLGWRSQERLSSTPRTPHERLASSLLQNSNSALNSSKASEEIQTSIKEVTSAIVHYVSGLEPSNGDIDRESSPRSSQKLFWLESSFVGTKPLESPQTPLVVSEALPPPHPHPRPPSALRLDLQRPAPDWQEQDRSLLNLNISKASPGSTTLEDVLDSLLGLPSAPNRNPTPQPSPRKAVSPYYQLSSKGPKYEQLSNSSATSRTFNQSTPSDDFQFSQRSTTPLSEHSAPGKDTVDTQHNTTMQETSRRPRSAVGEYSRRRSEPFSAQQAHSLDRRTSCDLSRIQENAMEHINSTRGLQADSKTSFHSATSINTENMSTDDGMVRCMYPRCASKANLQEAKKSYKVCHNCNYLYCSRECRRAHWEKHRKVCLHSRVSNLCRQIISTAKERSDCLLRISKLAFQGYTAIGRGVVKLFFSNPETAEKFVNFGYEFIGEPEYVKWTDLDPGEMGVELYTEVVRLCKTYSPDSKFILSAVVCVLSEVPTKGAVKWERQLVSRCAKIRLSRSITDAIKKSSSALSKQDKNHRKENNLSKHLNETLIFSSKRKRCNNTAELSTYRKACLHNIEKEFQHRGVNLKKDYPEVFAKLMAFVDGTVEIFLPITICPKDLDGKTLICVMMLETDDSITVAAEQPIRRIDVSRDIRTDLDSLSTPM